MDFLAYMAMSIFNTTVGTYLGMRLERSSVRTGESPSREIDPYTGLPKAHAEPDALASIEDIYAGNADAGIADVYAGISSRSEDKPRKAPESRIALRPAPPTRPASGRSARPAAAPAPPVPRAPSFDELERARYVMSRSRIGQLLVS